MKFSFRKAQKKDLFLLFGWANDEVTRKNSFQTENISIENHTKWFENKISDESTFILIFENELEQPIGQVRIENKQNERIIGISIDKNFRGKGLASKLITAACKQYFKQNGECVINAYIKTENHSSTKSFQKSGFEIKDTLMINQTESYLLQKTLINE